MLRKSGTLSLSGSVRLIFLLDSEHAQGLFFHDTKMQPTVNKRHVVVSMCMCARVWQGSAKAKESDATFSCSYHTIPSKTCTLADLGRPNQDPVVIWNTLNHGK